MKNHITDFRNGFPNGYTEIARTSNKKKDTYMQLGMVGLKPEEEFILNSGEFEVCVVLLEGKIKCFIEKQELEASRKDVFIERSFTVSLGPGDFCRFAALAKTHLAVVNVTNYNYFQPRIFRPHEVKTEHRGIGILDNTLLRSVSTIFSRNTHRLSSLVIGETMNFQGRWSIYPPHHHPQPEIYLYKFWPENGFGFAKIEKKIVEIKHNDATVVTDGSDHPHVAAPGYHMWYLWVIKHLKDRPYISPENTKEHEWVLSRNAPIWKPE